MGIRIKLIAFCFIFALSSCNTALIPNKSEVNKGIFILRNPEFVYSDINFYEIADSLSFQGNITQSSETFWDHNLDNILTDFKFELNNKKLIELYWNNNHDKQFLVTLTYFSDQSISNYVLQKKWGDLWAEHSWKNKNNSELIKSAEINYPVDTSAVSNLNGDLLIEFFVADFEKGTIENAMLCLLNTKNGNNETNYQTIRENLYLLTHNLFEKDE